MKKNLNAKGINVEKWLVFSVLFNLTIIESTTGVLEYNKTHNWLLITFAVLRTLSLMLGIYSVAQNKSTMIN